MFSTVVTILRCHLLFRYTISIFFFLLNDSSLKSLIILYRYTLIKSYCTYTSQHLSTNVYYIPYKSLGVYIKTKIQLKEIFLV